MANAYQGFDKRLKKIGRDRARMAQGYTSRVGKDGLIVFSPKRRQGGFPIKGLLMLAVGFFVFKGIVLAHLGGSVYAQRVETLATGSVVEQAGAFMMQTDPISQGIAHYVRPLIK